MTTQIDQLTNFLNDNGFKARPWREFRVYLNGYGKDIKAYIELDEPTAELGDSTICSTAARSEFLATRRNRVHG